MIAIAVLLSAILPGQCPGGSCGSGYGFAPSGTSYSWVAFSYPPAAISCAVPAAIDPPVSVRVEVPAVPRPAPARFVSPPAYGFTRACAGSVH